MKKRRRVRLFRTRRNRTARLSRDQEFPAKGAILREEGGRFIIELANSSSLVALLKTLSPMEETFPDIVDRAPDDIYL